LDEAALDALRLLLRRRIEAGVQLGHREWESWGTVVQNIYLQESDRVRRWQMALISKAVVSELTMSHLTEDMVYEDLPDEHQADIMQRRAQDETISRMTETGVSPAGVRIDEISDRAVAAGSADTKGGE
jgi:hypothetical protein